VLNILTVLHLVGAELQLIKYQSEPVENILEDFNKYQSEPVENIQAHGCNVLQYPDGTLLLCWYCGSHEGSEDQKIAAAVRDASGQWQKGGVLVNRFFHDGEWWIPEIGVPMLNPAGKTVIYFWAPPLSSFTIRHSGYWKGKWARSISYAKTFRLTVRQVVEQKPTCLFKEKGLVLQGSAVRLQSGRWMIPFHTEREDCLFHSRFLVADERQENWHQRGDIYSPPGCLEPSIAQLSDGDVLCYMRYGARGDGHVWRSVSKDEGESWSPPELTNLRNPHSGIDIALGFSRRLLIAYNDSYYLRTPLCIGISDDLGRTWRVRDIETNVGRYSYPKLLQTPDGLWHIFYTHNRTHIEHGWFDEEWLENGRRVIGLRD